MEGKGANLDILCQASKWLQKSLGLQNFCFAYLLMPLQCTHVFPYCFVGHKVKGIQMFTCNKYAGNCPTKNSYKKAKRETKGGGECHMLNFSQTSFLTTFGASRLYLNSQCISWY